MCIMHCYRSMKIAIENKDNFGKSHVPCESYGKIVCGNKLGTSFTETRFPAINATLNPWCLRIAITFHRNYFHAPFSRGADYIKYIAHAFPAYNACIKALVCAIHSAIYFIYFSLNAVARDIYILCIIYIFCIYL